MDFYTGSSRGADRCGNNPPGGGRAKQTTTAPPAACRTTSCVADSNCASPETIAERTRNAARSRRSRRRSSVICVKYTTSESRPAKKTCSEWWRKPGEGIICNRRPTRRHTANVVEHLAAPLHLIVSAAGVAKRAKRHVVGVHEFRPRVAGIRPLAESKLPDHRRIEVVVDALLHAAVPVHAHDGTVRWGSKPKTSRTHAASASIVRRHCPHPEDPCDLGGKYKPSNMKSVVCVFTRTPPPRPCRHAGGAKTCTTSRAPYRASSATETPLITAVL